jgi:hypothetical protein
MSEEDLETLESEIEFIEREDISFFDVFSAITNDTDGKILAKAFTSEQYSIIKAIVKAISDAYEFHDGKESESHPDLREAISKVEAKLRNHRHETGKSFSAKAEF